MATFDECTAGCHEGIDYYDEGDVLIDPLDQASVEVTILAPQGAVEANETPEYVCAGCAAKLCEGYIGFGWDVSARRMDRDGD
jgi:hypothetical protein